MLAHLRGVLVLLAAMSMATMSIVTTAMSAEWFVEVAAAVDGDGSVDRPFQRIADGLKAMQGGDTVTVRQGIYRETLSMAKGGSSDAAFHAAGGGRAARDHQRF